MLESVSVQVLERRSPVIGDVLAYPTGCGELQPRYFTLDLDAGTLALVPHAGGTAGQVIPAARFPFVLSEQDPELFLIKVEADLSSYSFRFELHWISDGQAGTTLVDNHGRPFAISSTSQAAVYCADLTSGAWQPSHSGTCS